MAIDSSRHFTSQRNIASEDKTKWRITKQEKIDLLGLSKDDGWESSPKRCYRDQHADRTSDILNAVKRTIKSDATRNSFFLKGNEEDDIKANLCQESLRRMPRLFYDDETEISIQSILEEFMSCIYSKCEPREPYAKHLKGACSHVEDHNNMEEIILEVLIRLPTKVIQLAGKKMRARCNNSYYQPSRNDIIETRKECLEAGVSPFSPGCVYMFMFLLHDKNQILERLHEFKFSNAYRDKDIKRLQRLIKREHSSSILYIGETIHAPIDRICKHFDSGMNSLILEFLHGPKLADGEVFAFPVVNIQGSHGGDQNNRKVICLVFEGILAAVLSMDLNLNSSTGTSTNNVACGTRIEFGSMKECSFEERFSELEEYKQEHGHCNVPKIFTDKPEYVQYQLPIIAFHVLNVFSTCLKLLHFSTGSVIGCLDRELSTRSSKLERYQV